MFKCLQSEVSKGFTGFGDGLLGYRAVGNAGGPDLWASGAILRILNVSLSDERSRRSKRCIYERPLFPAVVM